MAAILRIVYNALRLGGTLVFAERWWDNNGAPGEALPLMDLNVLFHPIRIKRALIEQFLSGFMAQFERRGRQVRSLHCIT